jgi:hypothetical protein
MSVDPNLGSEGVRGITTQMKISPSEGMCLRKVNVINAFNFFFKHLTTNIMFP